MVLFDGICIVFAFPMTLYFIFKQAPVSEIVHRLTFLTWLVGETVFNIVTHTITENKGSVSLVIFFAFFGSYGGYQFMWLKLRVLTFETTYGYEVLNYVIVEIQLYFMFWIFFGVYKALQSIVAYYDKRMPAVPLTHSYVSGGVQLEEIETGEFTVVDPVDRKAAKLLRTHLLVKSESHASLYMPDLRHSRVDDNINSKNGLQVLYDDLPSRDTE